MAKLVLFGAGDIAKLAHHYFDRDSPHEVVAFTVDDEYRTAHEFLGLPLLSFEGIASEYSPDRFSMFVALSYSRMNRVRAAKYSAAKALGYRLESYISTRCTFLSEHPTGDNCFILEDNTVQPFVVIGNDVTLWSGNHIGHDSVIEDHVFVSSHVVVSGNCRVCSYCFLGVNATLRNSITVGPGTLVGAGAVVMEDTAEGSVHVPPRAQILGRTSDEVEV